MRPGWDEASGDVVTQGERVKFPEWLIVWDTISRDGVKSRTEYYHGYGIKYSYICMYIHALIEVPS